MIENKYFAAQDARTTANELYMRMQDWSNVLEANGYLDKLRMAYAAYHGAYYRDTSAGHQITFSGEQGELVNLPVNHFRNIAQHILVMTTGTRPAMETRATNTDMKSLAQTEIANGVLDYYVREKHLETYLKTATEYAVLFGTGYIKMNWNATAGEQYDYIEETKTPIYEGDIEFSNLSPFDVFVDTTKEHANHDWYLVRSYKNKFDLAAKYPEFADKLNNLPSKTEIDKYFMSVSSYIDHTDDVPVYEFFHKRTDSMPDGRFMMFVSNDVIFHDMALPYQTIPVYRVSAGEIIGTPYGYTPMFDLLPMQEALNSLYSTVLTNQSAFGVQNILMPRGTDINPNSLAGGLNLLEYNSQFGKPEALNLTQTPAEVFKFIDMLKAEMETISGVNSVARGNPEASLRSGSALALVQSMALQFISGLQANYVRLIEGVGTGVIKILQDYAKAPRIVAISGKSNKTYLKEFSGQDISNISRVIVDVANPLSKSTAGRVQMAQELIQYGEITAKQYVTLIHTGNLDTLTEDIDHEYLLIQSENEKIREGEQPMVVVTDDHINHIRSHKSVLADPDLRKDPELVARATGHIQDHINQLRTADPQLLQLMNQPALPPQQPQQGQQQATQGTLQAPQEGMQSVGPTGPQGSVQGPGIPGGINVPQPATVNPALLTNPQLQEQSLGNVKKG